MHFVAISCLYLHWVERKIYLELNGEERTKSHFCSVLDTTLFFILFISPRFIILLALFYHFPIILLCTSFCHNERPSGDSIPVSLVQESNALTVEATSRLTISMRGQRATSKIQKNNYYHHGDCGPSLTGKTSTVYLIFTHLTYRNVKNRCVRSSSNTSQSTTLVEKSIS